MNIQTIEGHLYDAETGEYLGPAPKGAKWTPETVADAEWIGERLSELDAQMQALESRKAALVANIDSMIADVKRHRDGMLYKYTPALEKIALENLPQGKKTWTSPFLKIAFRTNPARLKVEDEAKALEWAKERCPEAVKVKESFLVSLLPDDVEAMLMAAPAAGFIVEPERETVKIETGVGQK